MSKAAKNQTNDAVAYHQQLASGWEQRYQKPAFRARLHVLEQCLAGRDVRDQYWLDAGCGSGTLARYLAEVGCRVLGVDASEEMIAKANELATGHEPSQRLRFERIDTIADLPLPDRSLDGILCSSVLEYVLDPSACLREFARVLRPEGLLVVSVANRKSLVRRAQVLTHALGRLLNQQWFEFLDHSHNEYTSAGFRAVLSKHCFATDKVISFGSPIPVWIQRRELGGSLLAFSAIRR